jgi:PP-loop superfamily ATP-utilizing enzyme
MKKISSEHEFSKIIFDKKNTLSDAHIALFYTNKQLHSTLEKKRSQLGNHFVLSGDDCDDLINEFKC